MRQPLRLLIFVLFLEEFILWEPRKVSTITELFLQSIVSSFGDPTRTLTESGATTLMSLVLLVNPLWSAILFFASIGAVASVIGSHASFGVSVLLRRYGWLLALIIFAVLLYQVRQLLSQPAVSANVRQIYQTKSLWVTLFVGVATIWIVLSDSSR